MNNFIEIDGNIINLNRVNYISTCCNFVDGLHIRFDSFICSCFVGNERTAREVFYHLLMFFEGDRKDINQLRDVIKQTSRDSVLRAIGE